MNGQPAAISLFLSDPDATDRLADRLAEAAGPTDTILLEGPIGSGKTHLARRLIRARLGREEDVPSPSFTLVQTYGDDFAPIWHADLYRLGHPDEVLELGLDDAFGAALCLVEWPDRLGSHLPEKTLTLHFSAEAEGRRISFEGSPEWDDRLRRIAEDWRG